MDYSKICEIYDELEATTKGLEKTDILADFFGHFILSLCLVMNIYSLGYIGVSIGRPLLLSQHVKIVSSPKFHRDKTDFVLFI